MEPTVVAPTTAETTAETTAVEPASVDPTTAVVATVDPPAAGSTTAAPADEVPAPPAAVPVADAAAGSEGPSITVNGQPFKGQGDPKLEGCSIVLAAGGLPDGSHTIVGAITSGEEGAVTLVSIDARIDGTSWTDAWASRAWSVIFERKPNGYQIRIGLTIDDGARLESLAVLAGLWRRTDGQTLRGGPTSSGKRQTAPSSTVRRPTSPPSGP